MTNTITMEPTITISTQRIQPPEVTTVNHCDQQLDQVPPVQLSVTTTVQRYFTKVLNESQEISSRKLIKRRKRNNVTNFKVLFFMRHVSRSLGSRRNMSENLTD